MGDRLAAGHANQFGDLAWVGTNAGTLEQMPGISYIDDLLQMGLGFFMFVIGTPRRFRPRDQPGRRRVGSATPQTP